MGIIIKTCNLKEREREMEMSEEWKERRQTDRQKKKSGTNQQQNISILIDFKASKLTIDLKIIDSLSKLSYHYNFHSVCVFFNSPRFTQVERDFSFSFFFGSLLARWSESERTSEGEKKTFTH